MDPQSCSDNSLAIGKNSQERQQTNSSTSILECEDVSNIETLASVEEEAADSPPNMVEALSKIFYVGAKFSSMEELRGKAQALGSQFNCPITTGKSSKNSYIILQCKHGGNYRKARKVEAKEKESDEAEEGGRTESDGRICTQKKQLFKRMKHFNVDYCSHCHFCSNKEG